MISIDRFEEILSDLAEEIPQSFYEELNGGIVVEPGYLLHPEDRNGTLYVMGQYRIDPAMGKYIVMYYGSFKRAYRHLDEDELTEEMRSASVRAAGLNALYIPLVMLASSAATAIVLVRGGDMVLEHGMLIGTGIHHLCSVHLRADSADGEGAGKHHFGAAEH